MAHSHDVFKALGDPTRQRIVELLVEKEALPLLKVASHFNMSRQAVTKHVKVLQRAKLVEVKSIGREQICRADLQRLDDVYAWLAQFKKTVKATAPAPKPKAKSLDDLLGL